MNQITGWVISKKQFGGEAGKIYEFNAVVKDNEGKGNYSQNTAVVKVTNLEMNEENSHIKNAECRIYDVLSI